jgi:hypothetical protein
MIKKLMLCLFLLPAASSLFAQCMSPDPSTGLSPGRQIEEKLWSGQTAVLCPNTVWNLTEVSWSGDTAINFTPDPSRGLSVPHDVYILTDTQPHDGSRATLRIATTSTSTAIKALDSSNAQIRNLIIDGGGVPCGNSCNGLIWFGGATTGQIVDANLIYNAKGWSNVLLGDGSTNCSYAQVSNNEIGSTSAPGFHDGISLQCSNSIVFQNYVHDSTDGGIVIFQAPGSEVSHNIIEADVSQMLFGISMIDFDPWGGNYGGTSVHDNTITANTYMNVGVAMGNRLLRYGASCQTGTNTGASVYNNSLYGTKMGYGFLIDGVANWYAMDNFDYSVHVGSSGTTCEGDTVPPQGYLIHSDHANGTFPNRLSRGVIYTESVLHGVEYGWNPY